MSKELFTAHQRRRHRAPLRPPARAVRRRPRDLPRSAHDRASGRPVPAG